MATATETTTQISMATTTQVKTELKVVLGTLNIGKEGAPQVRVHDLNDCAGLLDVFQDHGHNEVDTARLYGFGTSEERLGQLKLQERGLIVDTKLSPRKFGPKSYSHKKDDLKVGLQESLQALQTEKVDLWYLHTPDHNTPYKETLEAVNELYKAGYFKRFGISNFSAWEVAQICELCDQNGWKKPDVYQGVYHALQRSIEPELFPCLRHYGISFYSFSALAKGMLTDRYQRDAAKPENGSQSGGPQAGRGQNNFRKQYSNDAYFDALDVIRPVAKKLGMTTSEAAVRWSSHHSLMKKEHGDAVIIAASSASQLEENLTNLEKGPLPEELVEAFDKGWAIVKGVSGPYFQ